MTCNLSRLLELKCLCDIDFLVTQLVMDKMSSVYKGYHFILGYPCNLVWCAFEAYLAWSDFCLKCCASIISWCIEEDYITHSSPFWGTATKNSNLIVIEADNYWRASRDQKVFRNIDQLPALVKLCNIDSLNRIDPFARIDNSTKDKNMPIMLTASSALSSMTQFRHSVPRVFLQIIAFNSRRIVPSWGFFCINWIMILTISTNNPYENFLN